MKYVTVALRIALEDDEALDISKAVDCGDAEMIRTTQQYRIVRNWPLGGEDPNKFVILCPPEEIEKRVLPNRTLKETAESIFRTYTSVSQPKNIRLEVREVSDWRAA